MNAKALVVPNVGTVVLREDGSASIVDRNRQHTELSREIVSAIVRLARLMPRPQDVEARP